MTEYVYLTHASASAVGTEDCHACFAFGRDDCSRHKTMEGFELSTLRRAVAAIRARRDEPATLPHDAAELNKVIDWFDDAIAAGEARASAIAARDKADAEKMRAGMKREVRHG